jgi:hypothetical protein
MKIIRNQMSCFWILSVISIVFVFSSCATTSSMTGVEKVSSQTNENEKIIDTVKNFWKVSSEGDKENLPNYIREVPEEFWKACPSSRNLNGNSAIVLESNPNKIESDGNITRVEGSGEIAKDWKWEFTSLKLFSEQIKDKNVELVKARVERATDNEAVVKIDWRKFNSGDAGISSYMLLYKDNTGWKIFMATYPDRLEQYNKSFGYNDKCL